MTAPVEETVEARPPATGDRIRVRPRGVRARVKAGTPGARARVRALTPGARAPRPTTSTSTPDTDRSARSDGMNRADGAGSRTPSPAVASDGPSPSERIPGAAPATPGPAPAGSRRGSRFGRALRTHFGTLAGTAILVVVFWRMGTGVFVDGLRRIDGGTLAAAVGIGALTTVFSAWRWCAVTRALGLRLPLGPAVADYYRALFLNAALPGGVLGDVHRAVRHGQSSGDMGRGVRAVVIERTAGQLVLAVVGVTVLLVLPSPVLEQTRHAAGLTALAALGALAIWAAVRMGRRPSASAGGRGRRIRAVLAEARGVLLNRDSGPAVLFSSVAVLVGYVATFLLAADVAGSAATTRELLPLALLALIAMSLPLNVGGWGPREGVTAWSFGAAGLGASQGLTVAVVYGVLSFAAALPGALVLVGRWYGSLRARRQASEVTNEKYAPKDSTNPASNSFPFAADARDGRPITPESV
ncbi:Uncharacterized membrane protein YbhN, UPF0104 family [Streptomyces sp. cf124]|nr:Uncharacterized membrane protein YbhN, UPF0104 family [Streptomyces sp. cf124]